jgi:hypothetical protein
LTVSSKAFAAGADILEMQENPGNICLNEWFDSKLLWVIDSEEVVKWLERWFVTCHGILILLFGRLEQALLQVAVNLLNVL